MTRRQILALSKAALGAASLLLGACSPASDGDDDGSGGSSGVGGGSGGAPPVACTTDEESKFSFFVISNEATMRESGNPDGFGGDLGGLAGADAICQRVAEFVSPCQSSKVWHAFLSTAAEDAIDRIGQGPWYDRLGRLLANDLSELLNDRPINADPAIREDFPNEYGVVNSNPDGTGEVDNHQILTGSGQDGRLYRNDGGGWGGPDNDCPDPEGWTAEGATCWGWTTREGKGCPRVGHSFPGISGENWISLFNEGGCLPGGNLDFNSGGSDGTRRVGSAGGYGAWYCFAVTL